MRYLISLILISIYSISVFAQTSSNPNSRVPLKELQRTLDSLQLMNITQPKLAAKTTAANFDTALLAARINSSWGAGLTTVEKLNVFDKYWKQIDSFYSSFTGLPMYNWDSITTAMRTEISGGVSKGRFAGIMGQLVRYLNDGHTHFYDMDLFSTSSTFWGRPLLYGPSGDYGACLTMLNDSSAMVYSSLPGNVLGLQPGDRVLGYNNIPWKKLVPMLLRHQIPMGMAPYSTDSATWHRYITGVLSNFLMFDTLNIEKCDGTKINYPTTIMTSAYTPNNFCTEQIDIPGIKKMTYTDYFTNNKMVTWGVISGTGIGYVALYDCGDISGDSLLNPIKKLVEDSLVDGLIIDIRTNFGGSLLTYRDAFHYLNNGDFPWMGWAHRATTTDRYTMDPFTTPSTAYGTTDTHPNYFDKKIALLVGPGAVSAGDVMQILYTHHPKLKIIGKHTAGAFGAIQSIPMPYTNFNASRQNGDFYRAEDYNFYLSHHNFPIDSFVWFDRASVCNNKDNILNTAISWIKPELGVTDLLTSTLSAKIYPMPAAGNFNILLNTPVSGIVELNLYNSLGIMTAQTTSKVISGENKLNADYSELMSGSYILEIKGSGMGTITKKIVVIK
jgi:hypothetical protein